MKKNVEELNGYLRVQGYIRYSTVNQDDGFSVEYQMGEIKDFAARQGMEIDKIHIDQATTATKVAGRDAFHELVRNVKDGLVDVIIVYKMNRMFRSSEDSEYYRRIFRKNGVKLVSVTEHIDDGTSTGRLTTSILSNIDQYQAEVISDHVRAGLREMAKQGLYTGRPLLLGYKLDEIKHGKKKRKKFIVDEETAPLVRRLYQMYADGQSTRQICRILKQEGIKTRRGYNFSEQTLRRMLQNDFYIGTYRYKVEGYDEIVIENCVPAVIDKELFDKVQRRKKDNDPQLKPRYKKRLYALTGKMICGKCGHHYIGTNSQHTTKDGLQHYNYYTCSNRKEFKMCDGLNVRKEWIEGEIINKIKHHILNDQRISELAVQVAAMCENSPSEITKKIAELKSQQTKLENKYHKFVTAFLEDESSDNYLEKATITKLKNELMSIKKQLSVLSEQLRYSITPASITKYLNDMLKATNENDVEIWQEIYKNFVDKVIVTDNNIELKLKVFPVANIADKETMGLPSVTLSAIIHRLEKYKPKNFK